MMPVEVKLLEWAVSVQFWSRPRLYFQPQDSHKFLYVSLIFPLKKPKKTDRDP